MDAASRRLAKKILIQAGEAAYKSFRAWREREDAGASSGPDDPYTVLGVACDDPPELIDSVWRVKAKAYHPENKATGDEAKFKRLSAAHDAIVVGQATDES